MSKRRKFSVEFKRGAVEQASRKGPAEREDHVVQLGTATRVAAAEHHHEQALLAPAHAPGLALKARRTPKPTNITPASRSSQCMPRRTRSLRRARSASSA